MDIVLEIRDVLPPVLYPAIFDYVDDSLELFLESRDVVIRQWTTNRRDTESERVELTRWKVYQQLHRPYCSPDNRGCLSVLYSRVRHRVSPQCHCTQNVMWHCNPHCGVCGYTQFKS